MQVGKGNAPQMFDRVTISSEFYEIYVSPVEPDRIGTIVGIFRNGAECIVEWDPLPGSDILREFVPVRNVLKGRNAEGVCVMLTYTCSSVRM